MILWIASLILIWGGGAFMYANDFDLMWGILGDLLSYIIFSMGVILNLISFKEKKQKKK